MFFTICHCFIIECKVLSLLVNLRNLNLQGNPVCEKENLVKKVSFYWRTIFFFCLMVTSNFLNNNSQTDASPGQKSSTEFADL